MKYASTCPRMTPLGSLVILKFEILIYHVIIRLANLGLHNNLAMGQSIWTTILWFWNYRRRRWATLKSARATFSITWYLISRSSSTRLTKYTSLNALPSSWTSTILMASTETQRWTIKLLLVFSFHKIGGVTNVTFNYWKASLHCSSQTKFLAFSRKFIMGLC